VEDAEHCSNLTIVQRGTAEFYLIPNQRIRYCVPVRDRSYAGATRHHDKTEIGYRTTSPQIGKSARIASSRTHPARPAIGPRIRALSTPGNRHPYRGWVLTDHRARATATPPMRLAWVVAKMTNSAEILDPGSRQNKNAPGSTTQPRGTSTGTRLRTRGRETLDGPIAGYSYPASAHTPPTSTNSDQDTTHTPSPTEHNYLA